MGPTGFLVFFCGTLLVFAAALRFLLTRAIQNRSVLIDAIGKARACKVGELGDGLVKLQGSVRAVDAGALLKAPMSQKPCVCYRFLVEEQEARTYTAAGSSGKSIHNQRTRTVYTWKPLVTDNQSIAAVLVDDSGQVPLDLQQAELSLPLDLRQPSLISKMPEGLEKSIQERYQIGGGGLFGKTLRYKEYILEPGAAVFVLAHCEVSAGQPRLSRVGGAAPGSTPLAVGNPLDNAAGAFAGAIGGAASLLKGGGGAPQDPFMVACGSEQQLLDSLQQAQKALKGMAVGCPVVLVGASIVSGIMMWSSMHAVHNFTPPTRGPAPAPVSTKSTSPLQRAIDDLKDPKSDAWAKIRAAQSLAGLPVEDGRIDEVAPLLNPLFDASLSNNHFARDAAFAAIEHGWGTQVNAAPLQAFQQTGDKGTRDRAYMALSHLRK